MDMPLLDTRQGKDLMGTFIADLVLQILSFVAENERNSIRERQRQGIQAARQRGVRFGRRPLPVPEDFAERAACYMAGQASLNETLKALDMKRSTFYRRLAELKKGS